MKGCKILIAPGAFKHSLRVREVAEAIARGLRKSGLDAELVLLPIADGGNGTLDAFLVNGGRRLSLSVLDPLERPVRAEFGLLDDGQTAIIEGALASGLELLRPGELNPLVATSYGTGQLMQAALDSGASRIIVGMGGSAVVDGGAGCLSALGVRLLDGYGRPVPSGGGGLSAVYTVDAAGVDPRWRSVEVIIAADVDNPALGPDGAAAVFGPQKGAGPHEVRVLEGGLRNFFTRIRDQLGVDVMETPGGGAFGALAAGLMAVVGGHIQSGVDLLLDHNGFDDHLKDASLVVTGEGRLDGQTLGGKGPLGVARRARAAGVPVVAIVGGLDADEVVLHEAGINAVLPITPRPVPLEQALARAAEWLEATALRLGYLLQVAS